MIQIKLVTKKYSTAVAAVFLFALTVLTGCTPRLEMQIPNAEPHAHIKFSTGLSKTTESVILSMSGAESGVSLFPKGEITKFLCAAGFTEVSAQELGTAGFSAQLLQRTGRDAVIPVEIKKNDGGGNAVISVTPEHIRSVLSTLPANISDYTELLMAPVLTGEAMTAAEFIDLIAAAYGTTLATELAAATFDVALTVPGTVVSGAAAFTGGTYQAKTHFHTAEFSIPAAVLFSETTGFTVSVSWKQ